MKLTAKIKLLPTPEQAQNLIDTLSRANQACNALSEIAWENKQFKQFGLHKLAYYPIKEQFGLSAQMIVRGIAKVVDAYKLDKKTKREFRPTGAIAYDSRIISYKPPRKTVSIWTIQGRQSIRYAGGEHNEALLKFQQGESDLLCRKGKWFLLATCDVPDEQTSEINSILGVDLGIVDLATDSDGQRFTGSEIRKYRKKRASIRASVQAKKNAKASKSTIKNTRRLLKRISKKEQTTSTIINHTISKRLVKKAQSSVRGIALENLKGIRDRTVPRLRKKQRNEHSSWPFSQLRQFIAYKAQLAGVRLVIVPPAYTSKTCHECHHLGHRSGKSFTCTNCGNCSDADHNGAQNIAAVGASVTWPENSTLYCALHRC
ncbi:RNA-guided endonuclease InsQ/TnpB family protein [Larkinella humicola]|uniref:IS200/IS605 family element transposase accessory protein TnpB n=1 Tax=Larkinella humicola TaxID=2607654 RepID=A0A5N1JI36_9BACT|nr:RNA-guided endonuclease TnpB family protein [Larkinella humicola]KAA9352971.1 IS200/IS605 family element transposase accessory protein TnpB [Larkinella humicola]